MRLKTINLVEEEILAIEIGFLLGSKSYLTADNVNKRIEEIIEICDNDGMAVFGEFCKFMAHNYLQSTFDEGLERYIAIYADDLLDEFMNTQMDISPEEYLELINLRTRRALQSILAIPERSERKSILATVLKTNYKQFETKGNNFTEKCMLLAESLMNTYDDYYVNPDYSRVDGAMRENRVYEILEEKTNELFLEGVND